jgi:hypothetical protein
MQVCTMVLDVCERRKLQAHFSQIKGQKMRQEIEVDGKPSLADPAIVDRLVRGFAARVFATRAAWYRGEPGEPSAHEALVLIEQDARHMGAIFLGRDPAYDAPNWNRTSLQLTLATLLPGETKQLRDPGAALFYWLTAQLCVNSAMLEQDASTEHDAKSRMECATEAVKARLLSKDALSRSIGPSRASRTLGDMGRHRKLKLCSVGEKLPIIREKNPRARH